MKYRMYVDEVGDASTGVNIANSNDRYLSLSGVIIQLDYAGATVHPELEQLKQRFFARHPDEPLILHRKELVNQKPPFAALRDQATRRAFDEQILELMRRWEYQVITVGIDKYRHVQQYGQWRYPPYHYCMACLMERFAYFLNRRHVQGDIMAESRGGKEDRALKSEYQRIWEQGTNHLPSSNFSAGFDHEATQDQNQSCKRRRLAACRSAGAP